MNLARLSDKARHEFNLTCEILYDFTQENSQKSLSPIAFLNRIKNKNKHFNPPFYQHAINHMENALNALTRGVKYYQKLRKSRNKSDHYAELAPKHDFAIVKDIRDGIEHTDEHILKGKFEVGQVHSLFLNVDGVLLGKIFIDYTTISNVINELHKRTLDIVGENKP
jgi:hypothetical protein